MILADAAIWIDHLRRPDSALIDLLAARRIVMHSFVRGEVALGSVSNRARTLAVLDDLPQLRAATIEHVTMLIESAPLWNCGVGYVDAHLLAATLLTPEARLWTRDRRLQAQAERLGIAYAR